MVATVAGSAIETFAMNVGSEGGAYAASGDWRVVLDVRTWRMKATWIDGEAMAKPTSANLWKLLVSWRSTPDRTASLEVDEAALLRAAPAERRKLEGIVEHVGLSAEGRKENLAAQAAEMEWRASTMAAASS